MVSRMRLSAWQSAFSWLPKPTAGVKKIEAPKKIDPDLTAWCKETAMSFGLPQLAKQVSVVWNSRMRTTAGRAWWPARLIELNPKIDLLEPQQTARTLRHELAHLIAYERAGRRKIEPHGVEWRHACTELGIAGEKVCHQLPLPRATQKIRYLYFCPQCQTEIKRVKKIKRAMACYPCCKQFSGGDYDARFRLVEKRSA